MKSTSILAVWFVLTAVLIGAAQERAPDGTVNPTPVKTVNAKYTAAALKERIEGTVGLNAEVRDDGTVGAVKVTRSLDTQYGLDEAAIAAMRQWRFRPGTKDGKPAAVSVDVEMTFKLK
jgi:protein TonB